MPKAQNSPIRMYFLIQATENNGNLKAESECKACGLRMKVSLTDSLVGKASTRVFKRMFLNPGKSRVEYGKAR